MCIKQSPIEGTFIASVLVVRVFESVALKNFDDIPETFLSIHSIFCKGETNDPALPVLLIVVSKLCVLSYLKKNYRCFQQLL